MISKSRRLSKALSIDGSITKIIESTPVMDNNGQGDLSVLTFNLNIFDTINDLPLLPTDLFLKAFVKENNTLYLWTGEGWYKLDTINQTPIWITPPEQSYTLDSAAGNSPLLIHLKASDPEDIPISYTYEASDSAQYFVDVIQDSSQFSITTKSTPIVQQYDPSGGSFTITFRATDGINLVSVLSSFNLSL